MDLVSIARELERGVRDLEFRAPVRYVYNPLDYAWEPHRQYLERYGAAPKEVVLVGMNPGPWGMGQTGVPFGDVAVVRDWLGIEAPVRKPDREHPQRAVEGFACRRGEVSGRRLWGWVRTRFKTPARFFARFFVHNYCPLLFLEASGRNFTPDRLRVEDREELFAACDRALRRTVVVLEARIVIGVGRFAERRARKALSSLGVRIGAVPHPSPANPAANRAWEAQIEQALEHLGIELG